MPTLSRPFCFDEMTTRHELDQLNMKQGQIIKIQNAPWVDPSASYKQIVPEEKNSISDKIAAVFGA